MTWLWRHDDGLGYVQNWNALRAEQAAAVTERMLLGHAGPARVVGNRRDEAIIAERDARAAAMSRRLLRRVR